MFKKTLIVILGIILSSCAQRIYKVAYPTLSDGKYDTEFPYKNCASQLEDISNSVKLLNCMVFYKTYVFDENKQIIANEIDEAIKKNLFAEEFYGHQPVSGTATIIADAYNKVILLTCAHILDFPDTIYTFYEKDNEHKDVVQSISIREEMEIYVNDIPNGDKLEILAIDTEYDLAILGLDKGNSHEFVSIFDYPKGKSKELEWGSFVYIIGYPIGNKMITRGIVSNPEETKSGTFLIDALFNKGFSGGLVLAIRDGVPNFELVGLARSVSAQYNYILVPAKERHEYTYNPKIPYRDEAFVMQKEEINYGITHAITVEEIVKFIEKNQSDLMKKGYDLSKFLDQ
ncbi:serine protease [Candidatus Cloacimonadota bacterium]